MISQFRTLSPSALEQIATWCEISVETSKGYFKETKTFPSNNPKAFDAYHDMIQLGKFCRKAIEHINDKSTD